jgi:thioredoxin reductase
MSDYDVAVVGGGAAGLSAALVLSRARRTVVVVDAGSPRNAPASHMHGFLSRDGTPPRDLLATGQEELKRYDGELVAGAVDRVTQLTVDRFLLELHDGTELTARRLLVATGLRDEIPEIPGLRERWGRDLLHCPYCHGYEVREQPLAVIGGTAEAVQHAHLVRQWSADVLYFPHDGEVTAADRERLRARDIGVIDGTVTRLVIQADRLMGVALDGERCFRRSAVFVRPHLVPNTDLLVRLGCDHENGWVVADATGRTSVPGVWVAGNVMNPRGQVITAAGEGSSAAIALNADLVEEDIQQAVRRLGSN